MNGAVKHAAFVLTVLLLLNAALNPQFISLRWQDGHVFGPLVDIVNRAARVEYRGVHDSTRAAVPAVRLAHRGDAEQPAPGVRGVR